MWRLTFPSTRASSDMVRTVSTCRKTNSSVVVKFYVGVCFNHHTPTALGKCDNHALVTCRNSQRLCIQEVLQSHCSLEAGGCWMNSGNCGTSCSSGCVTTVYPGQLFESIYPAPRHSSSTTRRRGLSAEAPCRCPEPWFDPERHTMSNVYTSQTICCRIFVWPLGGAQCGQLPADVAAGAWPVYDTCSLTGHRCTWYMSTDGQKHFDAVCKKHVYNYTYDGPQVCIYEPAVTPKRERAGAEVTAEQRLSCGVRTISGESGRCYTHVASVSAGNPRTAMLVADNWCPQPALSSDGRWLPLLLLQTIFHEQCSCFWPKPEHCYLQRSVPYAEWKCMAESCPEESWESVHSSLHWTA